MSLDIGLIEPKSPTNVGAVLRAANCFGVNSVFYTGSRYDRAEKFNTDTKNARSHIPLCGVEDLLQHVSANTKVVCVELVVGALLLPNFDHPENVFYIFGPEDGTIAPSLLDHADSVVYIPSASSLNLAASVNVVLYDRLAKSDLGFANDAYIRKIRDTNNNSKLKDSL